MVNATRATGREKLWCWQRAFARALPLMCVLAGMTLGTVAHAQIAFRAAAQAGTPGSSTIAFRAAASAAVDSGVLTLTISKPTGTVQGDVMITSIAIRPNTATIALLAGWTLVRRTNNTLGTASSLAVYRKVAGASEPASYTWTLGGAPTGTAGGIQTFSGVDTTTPIDVDNGAATTAGTYTPATPSVTTTVANTMLVTAHGIPNRDLWADPPTWGGTQGFQVRAGVAPIMAQGSWALQAAIGATGTKTATDSGPDAADNGNAHILALRPVSSADLTITKPTGTVQNDVMIASVAVRPETVTVTPPAGWTLVRRIDNTVATRNSLVIYRKVAGAGEPANYTWTLSAHTGAVGGIATFSGVNTASPVDVENGQVWTGTVNPAGFDVVAPSVTTTVANAMLVTSYALSSSGTSGSAWTPPTGMTEATDISSGNGNAGESIEVNHVVQPSAGATGTKTATMVGHDDGDAAAHIVALRPATPATLSSAASQTFTVGQAATVASTLTVTDSSTATITVANNIRIRIPATFNMTWDPTVTTVTLGGTASAKVSTTLLAYEDGNKTVVLSVTTNFAASDQVTVTGLKFANFTAVSAADNLQLVVAGTGGATAATDDKTITIVAAGGGAITAEQSISACVAPGGIAVVAAAQAGIATPTTTLTINKPTGTVANHVMVASIGFRLLSPGVASTDIGVTPPAGWTLVRRLDNANSTSSGLAVYRKVAGASEPASYAWTFFDNGPTWTSPGFSGAAGGIVSFSGVDTTTPLDVENGLPLAAATTTPATPSVTTTVADTMLVTSHAIPNANTWANPPTSGMTQAFQQATGGEMIQVSTILQAAAGATGTKTATDLGPDAVDFGNVHILALRPAALASLTLPSWTPQAGELLLVGIAMRDETITHSVSGNGLTWTLVADRDNDRGQMGVALYRASGPSPTAGSIVITLTGNTKPAFAVAVRLSGVDTAAVNQGIEALATASGPAVTDDANMKVTVTTVTANAMALAWGGQRGSGTLTVPAEETIIAQSGADCGTGGDRMRGHMWREMVATPGPTQLGQDNSLSAAQPWAVIAVSIKPTPGGGPLPPGGFNVFETGTAAAAITGVIKTRVAGSAFGLDVVAISTGAQDAGFTDQVTVELLGNNTLGVSLDANNCPTTSTLVQTVSPNPTITAGRSTVNFAAVANSWRDVRARVRWPTSSPTVTSCSTDNFAIRPNTLANFAVTDTDWATAGTGRTLNLLTFAATTPTHKAGQPFSVRATAVNAAGSPATTTNYAGAPTATLTACGSAACTATFGTLTLSTAFAAGQLTSDVASYNDVGSFSLQLLDSAFASVDASDGSTTTERNISSAVINVGRFVPDHFAVALNTPVFGTACAAGNFSYAGQAFGYTTPPLITVTAQDSADNTTTRYNTIGGWFRITGASLTGKAYTAATGTLDTSGLPGTDPVIASSGAGVGTLTFGSGTGIFFTRTTPVAPFDADLSLAINVIDADGVSYASNPARFATATAGNGIVFNSGKAMRFGRLRLNNASGSSLLDLPLPLSTQYYDGSFFVTNTLDSCTTLLGSDLRFAFLGTTPNLVACETAINPGGTIFFVGGKASATASPTLTHAKLAKPGGANDGAVDIGINLNGIAGNRCTAVGAAGPAATNANKPWLQGNWSGGTYTEDPTGRATFGIFKNADKFLHFRELY